MGAGQDLLHHRHVALHRQLQGDLQGVPEALQLVAAPLAAASVYRGSNPAHGTWGLYVPISVCSPTSSVISFTKINGDKTFESRPSASRISALSVGWGAGRSSTAAFRGAVATATQSTVMTSSHFCSWRPQGREGVGQFGSKRINQGSTHATVGLSRSSPSARGVR